LNLIYTFPDQDVQLIWKYARGWKSGHWNALATLQEAGNTVSPAEPETIDDFEMKLSGKWFDERVWLDASLFYYKYNQYQVFIIDSQPNQPPQLKIINANNAQVYGAEVTMVAQPLLGLVAEEIEGLRVEARFGWLESEFLDFTNDVYKVLRTGDFNTRPTSVTVDYSGNRLINSPQFKLSLTATWMLDLGRWGQIIPRYDGAWSSDIYFNQAEGRRTTQLDIPGVPTPKEFPECAIGQCAFWLHNLRLDYLTPNGKLKIGGWVRNIENTVFKTYGFDASEFGALTVAYVSEPRMYGLDFTVNW
jgi:iron complex outermembrane receptor protein